MRKFLRFAPAAVLAGLALPAFAQQPILGTPTAVDCTAILDSDAENAELYVIKVPSGGDCTDMTFDLRGTGGLATGGADAQQPSYYSDPNFRVSQAPTDVQFVVLTYPPAPNGAGRIVVDSNNLGIGQDLGLVNVQVVGNSPPSAAPYNVPGVAGIDLTLAGTSATYGVKLRGNANPSTANFPQMAGGGGVLQGIEVAFSPVIEVNNTDVSGGSGCSIAGQVANGATTSPAGNDGVIIGYNVFRLAGTAAARPDALAFYNGAIAGGVWQYFIPMTSTFNLALADTNPGSPTPPAPGDSAPNDLGGLQNPDGTFGTGDEVIIFQDSSSNRGTGRASGTAPVAGQGYWYAFQPVVCGLVSDFAAKSFGPAPGSLNGDHTLNRVTGGGADSVDLDLNGSLEFFSPQADAGMPGLGLTYNHLPLLSAAVFADGTRPLPATGHVTLSGRTDGASVNLTFQSGLEAGTVQGFNVYRGVGQSRVLVNTDHMIVAQGGESSVYTLVDDAVQARRLSKGGTVQYTVDIVYQDGHTSTVGPFAVTIERGAATTRRSR